MTVNELLQSSYGWADANSGLILGVAVAIPVLGAVAAAIGKGGETDQDGRKIANALVAIALLAFAAEIAGALMVRSVLQVSLLDANAALLLAPPLCLILTLISIRLVFPLNRLASWNQAGDMVGFVVACWFVYWLFGRFHWGVYFIGTLFQLFVILVLGGLFLRRLFRRAVGLEGNDEEELGSL
jgi:hypothetical protein